MPTLNISAQSYQELFGLIDPKEIAYAEELISSLGKFDSDEIKLHARHPHRYLINKGIDGIADLIRIIDSDKEIYTRIEAVDALSHIFLQVKPTPIICENLRGILLKEKNIEVIAVLAKCIAVAQDEIFLLEQMKRLGDEDPGVVSAAAQLLGYGRYATALSALCLLVSPSRFYESRALIWAIGEIGQPSALPYLERCIQEGFRTAEALIAIGKIGSIKSISSIINLAFSGDTIQKECAYRALAMLLQTVIADESIITILAEEFGEAIRQQLANDYQQLNWECKFFMVICLARLQFSLQPSQIRRYLEISVKEISIDKQVSALRL